MKYIFRLLFWLILAVITFIWSLESLEFDLSDKAWEDDDSYYP